MPRDDVLWIGGLLPPDRASIEADATYVAQQFTDGANTQTENALGTNGASLPHHLESAAQLCAAEGEVGHFRRCTQS